MVKLNEQDAITLRQRLERALYKYLAREILPHFEGTNPKTTNIESLSIEPVDTWTIGTIFFRVDCQYVSNGKKGGKNFLIKQFVPRETYTGDNRGDVSYWRVGAYREFARHEHALNSFYYHEGCNVPKSYVIEKEYGDILIMEDLGTITLEDRVQRATLKEREQLLKTTLERVVYLHSVGNEKQVRLYPQIDHDAVFAKADIMGRAKNYIKRWLTRQGYTGENINRYLEEFENYFGDIALHLTQKAMVQLIHGDLDLHHIISRNGDIYFTDFEKTKVGHPAFDVAGILMSPSLDLNRQELEEILKVYQEMKMKLLDKEIAVRLDAERGLWIDKKIREGIFNFLSRLLDVEPKVQIKEEAQREFLKTFYYASIFETIRRPTKLREHQVYWPEEWSAFIQRFPVYRSGVERYKASLFDNIELLVEAFPEYNVTRAEAIKLKNLSRFLKDVMKNSSVEEKSENEENENAEEHINQIAK